MHSRSTVTILDGMPRRHKPDANTSYNTFADIPLLTGLNAKDHIHMDMTACNIEEPQ